MKRIRTARELYDEIVKSFYFGIYQTGDRLLTYEETHKVYHLAKNTIGVAYTKLRQNGFIRTDRKNGTTVTFDRNNPAHLAKVPLEWPQPGAADTAPYEFVMRLHGKMLYAGLICSNEEQLLECKKLTEEILRNLQDGRPYYNQVFQLWMCMVEAMDNKLVYRITDHFLNRYLYFVPPQYLPDEKRSALRSGAQKFYAYLLDAIDCKNFKAFPERFEQHYNNYYQAGGITFSKLEKGTIFNEQTLYERLLEDLCLKIAVGDLRKGDTLPTTPQLCKEYGVSRTTVNRAYGILVEMGLVDRHVRSGTRLIAEPNDPEIRKTLEKAVGYYQHDWNDAEGTLMIISSTLGKGIDIPPIVWQQMEEELARQRMMFDQYGRPYSVFAVLISPVIANLPLGIIHKYYDHLMDILTKMVLICTFRAKGKQEHAEEIYRKMVEALDALKRGDQALFATLTCQTISRNVELLTTDYIENYSTNGQNNWKQKI